MNDIKILFQQAIKGTLPSDFSQWSLCDNDGTTVAHMCYRVF